MRPSIPASTLLSVLPLLCGTAGAQDWVQTSPTRFGNSLNDLYISVVHDGWLYTTTTNTAQGAEVWRHDGNAPWVATATGGFGDANNEAIAALVSDGDELFALTTNTLTGTEAWVFDGSSWSQTNADGFGDRHNVTGRLYVLNGVVHASTYNDLFGCAVHRYDGSSHWTTIGRDGFGQRYNVDADLTFVGGHVYAGTYNDTFGCEVHRHDGGTNWTRVDPRSGFDASGWLNEEASVYDAAGTLFVGTYNEATGTEVWEYLGGTFWVQRNVDGFGDPRNIDIEPVTDFGGSLYLGTTSSLPGGGEVWRYDGGASFVEVGADGFGSPANLIVLFLAVYDDHLYASTYNPWSGAQVWRYVAGMSWVRVDPASGFGDPLSAHADLDVFRGELYATTPAAVWRLVPDSVGDPLCGPGTPNSTGLPGRIEGAGRPVLAANDLTLSAVSLPLNSFGFFIVSRTTTGGIVPPGSVGVLCLGGAIGRYVGPGEIQNSGAAGAFSLAIDLTHVPQPTGFVSATVGETWHFQVWHRDALGGVAVSNFTEGLSVTMQ